MNTIDWTFDESAAEFVLDAMGYKVKDRIILKNKKPVKCTICNTPLTLDDLGGFIKNDVFCNAIPCLIKILDATKDKIED